MGQTDSLHSPPFDCCIMPDEEQIVTILNAGVGSDGQSIDPAVTLPSILSNLTRLFPEP
jgi:hypothetical protein